MASCALTLAWALASLGLYETARRKVDLIEFDRAKPNSSIFFSLAECNAFAAGEAARVAPTAVRNSRLTLGSGRASAKAMVDFAKLQTDRGQPPGRLMAWLLRGDRPISASVRISSDRGQAQVDILEVRVSGVPISGRALDLLLEHYLLPRYPEVVIGKPFALRHRVERIDVSPQGVGVRIGS